jgi:hypothetical protein
MAWPGEVNLASCRGRKDQRAAGKPDERQAYFVGLTDTGDEALVLIPLCRHQGNKIVVNGDRAVAPFRLWSFEASTAARSRRRASSNTESPVTRRRIGSLLKLTCTEVGSGWIPALRCNRRQRRGRAEGGDP